MPRPEIHYSAEPDPASTDYDDEQERIAEDATARDLARTTRILADVISNQTALTSDIASLVGKLTNKAARDALEPKLATHDAETVADASKGGPDLDALEKKVDKLLQAAETENKQNDNGAAKEGKFSKAVVALSALVAAMPFIKDLFELLVKAANGTLTASDISDAADRALIEGLIAGWKNETDTEYWEDCATFYQVHNAGSAVKVAAGITKEDPTCADMCLILNLTTRMFPVPPTKPFSWPTAQDKVDTVKTLAKTLDATKLAGKVAFIKSLADLKFNSNALPRGIQSEIGALAVAEAIT
jgi:hypothetical protein